MSDSQSQLMQSWLKQLHQKCALPFEQPSKTIWDIQYWFCNIEHQVMFGGMNLVPMLQEDFNHENDY